VFTNPTWDSGLLLSSIPFPSAMGASRRCRFLRAVCLRFVSVRFSKGKGLHQYGYTSLRLFGDKLKGRLKHSSPIWHLLRGIVIWTIWIKRNDSVFNQKQWPHTRPKSRVWVHLMEYARTARTQGPSLWCGVIRGST
jgi:hypothetical protein